MEKQSAAAGASRVVRGAPALAALAAAAAFAHDATLQVGRLALHRCATGAPWCAVLDRPLEPGGAVAATIPVYFEYFPHTAPGPAAGTLVATEGGPGYPATESRDEYLSLFAPLRPRYDVIIMDNRGTGRSGAIDCRELQEARALTVRDVGACGRTLGPAAPFYRTAFASDDLAAILEALGTGPVGLYGNSYGSYFAQVFALRHRELVRSLVLDGADPVDDPDLPWYEHYATATRDKFDLACAHFPECGALRGNSLEHIAPALERLRAQPFQARVRYGHAQTLTFTANASALAIVMFGGSPALATVRELDAAARAFVAGDSAPLLRLMAETLSSVDSRDPTRDPKIFSAGLFAAVSCQDPPQLFDMRLPPAQRRAERDRIIARRKAEAPATYAPFTIDEYRGMPIDYSFIDLCADWPSPPASPPSPLAFSAASYPDLPVLVVSGELDNMTNPADGAAAARHFPHARHVVMAGSFHVNALPHARSGCAAVLVRRFMETLDTGDESCAAEVPAVRLVPRFARAAHELMPARASADNRAGDAALRVVSAALFTAEDVITRAVENGGGRGVGLRGGSFTAAAAGEGYRLALADVAWTEDVVVSGRIDAPRRGGVVRAQIELRSPAGSGALELEWSEGVSGARATARGSIGGVAVMAEAPAP